MNVRSKSVVASPIVPRYASIGLVVFSCSAIRIRFTAFSPARAARKSNARWPTILCRRSASDPSRGNWPSAGNVFVRSRSRMIARSCSVHSPRWNSANPSCSQPGRSRRTETGIMSNASLALGFAVGHDPIEGRQPQSLVSPAPNQEPRPANGRFHPRFLHAGIRCARRLEQESTVLVPQVRPVRAVNDPAGFRSQPRRE
jgi:hypothetical protein